MIDAARCSTLLACVAINASLAGCAGLEGCRADSCTADLQTDARVRALIDEQGGLGPPDRIAVRTRDHVVYLYGLVDTEMEREFAQSLAARAAGGDRVVSLIGVQNR
jgi:hypothetical protein